MRWRPRTARWPRSGSPRARSARSPPPRRWCRASRNGWRSAGPRGRRSSRTGSWSTARDAARPVGRLSLAGGLRLGGLMGRGGLLGLGGVGGGVAGGGGSGGGGGSDGAGGSAAANAADLGVRAHAAQLADFVTAIDEGREPAVTAADARATLELVWAVYQSGG